MSCVSSGPGCTVSPLPAPSNPALAFNAGLTTQQVKSSSPVPCRPCRPLPVQCEGSCDASLDSLPRTSAHEKDEPDTCAHHTTHQSQRGLGCTTPNPPALTVRIGSHAPPQLSLEPRPRVTQNEATQDKDVNQELLREPIARVPPNAPADASASSSVDCDLVLQGEALRMLALDQADAHVAVLDSLERVGERSTLQSRGFLPTHASAAHPGRLSWEHA